MLSGQPRLRARRFRAWTTAWRAGLAATWQAFWGAFTRARAGANREPLQ
jgi:hypothetical protein